MTKTAQNLLQEAAKTLQELKLGDEYVAALEIYVGYSSGAKRHGTPVGTWTRENNEMTDFKVKATHEPMYSVLATFPSGKYVVYMFDRRGCTALCYLESGQEKTFAETCGEFRWSAKSMCARILRLDLNKLFAETEHGFAGFD
jgi:hypothetical protein